MSHLRQSRQNLKVDPHKLFALRLHKNNVTNSQKSNSSKISVSGAPVRKCVREIPYRATRYRPCYTLGGSTEAVLVREGIDAERAQLAAADIPLGDVRALLLVGSAVTC